MPRRAVAATLAAFLAGVLTVVLLAATDERHLAFSLAVRPATPGVEVRPGHEACQRDVDVEESFDSLTVLPAAFYHPVPRLALRVVDRATRRTVATGLLHDGHPENRPTTIYLGARVPKGRPVDVCFRNRGAWRLAFFSAPASDNEPSFATLDGRYVDSDIVVDFLRHPPRTTLSMVPDVFRRAALFHPSWVGAWTFWLLLAVLVVGVPAALAGSVRAAARGEPGP
jgi:hypothetical protein